MRNMLLICEEEVHLGYNNIIVVDVDVYTRNEKEKN